MMEKKHKDALRLKLIGFSVMIVIIPMTAVYLTTFAFLYSRSQEEKKRYAWYNIQSVSQSLDSAFNGLNELQLNLLINSSVYSYLSDRYDEKSFIRYSSSVQFLPFASKYYNSVTILSDDRPPLTSGTNYRITLSAEEREKADELKGGSFLSARGGEISIIRLIRDYNYLSEHIGYIKITISRSALEETLSSPPDLPLVSYVLITRDGVILQNGTLPEAARQHEAVTFDRLYNKKFDSEPILVNGKTYLYSSRPVFRGKLAVVSFIEQAALYPIDPILAGSIFVILIISSLFIIIVSGYYTQMILSPIRRLGTVMLSIEKQNFETDFSLKGNNEITILVEQFKLMCGRIKNLYSKIQIDEIKLREAELAVLQSNINPHFLYNTLETIYWMSEMSHAWKTSEMIRSLSILFRIILEKSANGFVPLSTEREYVQCYLSIQKIRLQDQINFEFYVQDNIDDLRVLKLLLQPIVENAIVHGKAVNGQHRVIINIYQENDELVYRVFNDGSLPDPGEIQKLMDEDGNKNGRRGLAIRNVNARLKICFGDKYGLTFETPAGGGVLATIRQPVIKKDENL
jgi:two-component system sensor histidine kinase YesM